MINWNEKKSASSAAPDGIAESEKRLFGSSQNRLNKIDIYSEDKLEKLHFYGS